MRHGSRGGCLLAPDESGRVLDRLAALEKVITMAIVRQVLRRTGRVNTRACVLTHEITLWIVLAMGLFTNVPISCGEPRMTVAMVKHVPDDALLIQDRGFFSYKLWKAFAESIVVTN